MTRRRPQLSDSKSASHNGGIDLDERKERVLHTRVPQSLDRQLKRRARNLGLSVSTVVRHVLLNTFGLVEDIVTDSTNIALSLAGDDAESDGPGRERGTLAVRRSPQAVGGTVVGWQEAVLNLNAVCERCNAVLRKGARVAIGVREGAGPLTVICAACLDGFGTVDGAAARPARRPARGEKASKRRRA